ncbi:glycosyltransferase family 4 protein [Cohnella sp. CFH 77786]|uniref:glycosyltransferase family 4 protein n=1 Tax=Cohnella sp. CFH 77786 TaxID=2662265 RepID=UPI001C60E7C2|nr:glycosyltransferase family 4 protein [Cohnella sp. CFH 77786]
MTVFMLPIKLPGNKYMELLVRSLEQSGLTVKPFDKKKIYEIRRGDILHIHWPSFHYTGRNFVQTAVKTAVFLFLLLYLKLRGAAIVWTVHNVWPHKDGPTRFHRRMRILLCRVCSKLIVMGDSVRDELVANFHADAGKIICIPHGHFKEAYPSRRLNIRERFGIPEDAYLFAFIGQISPYKGLDLLLRSFKRMGDAETRLLIAGKPTADFDVSILQDAGDRVYLSLDFVKDEELADFLQAADSVVLPYRNITTSGSAILALSFYRPVVAPDLGLLRDYLTPETSILYDPSDPDGLMKAMREMKEKRERYEDVEPFDYKLAELEWSRISEMTSGVYGNRGRQVGRVESEAG